jgi:hypothetical protein
MSPVVLIKNLWDENFTQSKRFALFLTFPLISMIIRQYISDYDNIYC